MEVKLYVGNLSYDTSEEQLRSLFSEAGTVSSVDLIMDRDTHRPKGFGFVTMSTQVEAEKAISLLNGKEVDGRALTVNAARPREERPMGGDRGGHSFGNQSRHKSSKGGGGYNNRY